MYIKAVLTVLCCMFSVSAIASEDVFTAGPVFGSYGKVADVETTFVVPEDAHFKVSFDASTHVGAGELNRILVSAARFINMTVRSGVAVENIDLAIVVHGKAVYDVSRAARYETAVGGVHVNAALAQALMETGVQIIVCGQSAVYYDVALDDLLPGVKMGLSAMAAHALLQQNGYTLNPF